MQKSIAMIAAALFLSGCSQASPLEDLADGSCNSALVDLVDSHISGQIDALAENDWVLAHSFASDDFQSNVSVDDFTLIIGNQYSMLLENQGYQFTECTVAGSRITQEVKVQSGEQEFSLTYTLSVNGSRLGVESAVVSESTTQENA
jgi:hypothetical protein